MCKYLKKLVRLDGDNLSVLLLLSYILRILGIHSFLLVMSNPKLTNLSMQLIFSSTYTKRQWHNLNIRHICRIIFRRLNFTGINTVSCMFTVMWHVFKYDFMFKYSYIFIAYKIPACCAYKVCSMHNIHMYLPTAVHIGITYKPNLIFVF